jgi:hypothetical protein
MRIQSGLYMLLCSFRVKAFVVTASSSRRYSQSLLSRAAASSESNSEQQQQPNDNEAETETASPKTGWNHNLPDPKSEFWQGGAVNGGKTTPKQPGNNRGGFRTGWLHNTAPKKEMIKQSAAIASTDNNNKSSGLARKRLELAMKQQAQNHCIVSPPTFHACGTDRCIVETDHSIRVPLNRNANKTERITIRFRMIEKVTGHEQRAWFQQLCHKSARERAMTYVEKAALQSADDMILYLQGGPGFGAPAPIASLGLSDGASWASAAMDNKFERIVLMDQRGTGRSSPVTKQFLELKFPELFVFDGEATDKVQELYESHPDVVKRVKETVPMVVDYLSHFRADNIVLDAEEIRDALLLPTLDEDDTTVSKPWGCALGQSFGGFCLMTYLSQVKDPPRTLLFTGGIAPMTTPLHEVYRSLWERTKDRSLLYYEMYPGDVSLVKKIIRRLIEQPVPLPSGGTLTARRFLQLGLSLGGSPSSFASLHSLLESAFLPIDDTSNSEYYFKREFLKQLEVHQSFDDAPIYFWLHEAIYADGSYNGATNWTAHKILQDNCKTSPEFDYTRTCSDDHDGPVLFYGEHVFPWQAEDYAELDGFGLAAVAEGLAQKDDWGQLYDKEMIRKALNDKSVASAVVYHDDMCT